MDIAQKNTPKVVIIGAGFGGLKAAKRLRRAPVSITLIDRTNHHLFQPLLYQVATATLSPADIASPIRSVVRDQLNTHVMMAEVTGIDLTRKKVLMGERSVSFDYLIVATGARHSYFAHPEWEANAPGLKTLADAVLVRQKILLAFETAEASDDSEFRKEQLTFVLVGGGPTGVETAGAIAELSHRALASDFRKIDPTETRVILIEAGPRILGGFPEKLSSKAARELEKLGVEVRTSARVTAVNESSVHVGNEKIRSRNIIWAAGVRASPVGRWLGVETDSSGRVKVDGELHLPGRNDIFIVGDASLTEDEKGNPLPGVAPVAMQEGTYAAENILAQIAGKTPKPFQYWDKGNLATVGRGYAVAEMGTFKLSGMIAWWTWLVVHIYYLIGFRNRILVMIQWAWAYLTFQRGARLITEYQKGTPSP